MNKGILTALIMGSIFVANLSDAEESNSTLDTEAESIQLSTVISAKAIDRKSPRYPVNAAKRRKEGWVQVSFVVDEEGNVKDPIIHDSSGNRMFEKAALKAVKQWQYEAATFDGKPVEQCDSKVQLTFRLEGNGNVVSRKFKSLYSKINKAISAKELDEAGEMLQTLRDKEQRTYAESTHLAVVSAYYYQAMGNEKALVKQLKAIVNIGHEFLPDVNYMTFANQLYSILAERNKISEAIEVYDEAKEHFPDSKALAWITATNQKLKSFIDNSESLVIEGQINDESTWFHQLYYNQFDLVSKGAPLERIELRCKNRRSTYGNVKKQGFKIPESWGQCYIYIDAAPDTEFTLAEYRS